MLKQSLLLLSCQRNQCALSSVEGSIKATFKQVDECLKMLINSERCSLQCFGLLKGRGLFANANDP